MKKKENLFSKVLLLKEESLNSSDDSFFREREGEGEEDDDEEDEGDEDEEEIKERKRIF